MPAETIEQTSQMLSKAQEALILSKKQSKILEESVQNLQKDQEILTKILSNITQEENFYQETIQAHEERIKTFTHKKIKIEQSLAKRRFELAKILAGLERIGMNPPPVLMIHAQDALESIRSSAVLAALVPNIETQIKLLFDDVNQSEATTLLIRKEQKELSRILDNQQKERTRLSLILSEKEKIHEKSKQELLEENNHHQELAKKILSLQEFLIKSQNISSLKHKDLSINHETQLEESAPFMKIQTRFSQLRGLLPPPVTGRLVQSFSSSFPGELIETEPGAIVTSPVEAIVRYAGLFRSYGRIVILDAGENYHLILSALDQINVTEGQMILQGEPIGSMGTQFVATVAKFNIGKKPAMLYIELRKDGKPVNPAPWWIDS